MENWPAAIKPDREPPAAGASIARDDRAGLSRTCRRGRRAPPRWSGGRGVRNTGDDRQALAMLSDKTGVAVSTINDRIKRLVRTGMISGFHARLVPEALGLNLLAFILVSWSNPKVEAAFLEKVKASPDVLECHHITGAWNYLIKVRVGTTRDLEKFLAETIKNVDGVERTETLIALSTAKESWKVALSSEPDPS
jgi:Lrp/AsnC family transcriptional regulator, leucine-responsive regulatory protein